VGQSSLYVVEDFHVPSVSWVAVLRSGTRLESSRLDENPVSMTSPRRATM
jgi:hypothetical protein